MHGNLTYMSTKSSQIQIRVSPRERTALHRLARRAGQSLSAFVLARALPSARLDFERLIDELARREGREGHRYVLAEVNDFLTAASSGELEEAVSDADVEALSPFLQNYVTAMVELACQRRGLSPPTWTSRVQPLDEPWFATDLPSLRLHLLRAAPVAFKRRNLFVDSSLGDRV